ncbi:MAG: HEAT repeat domain-containing protein [Planctomycetota bacterium]
MPVYVRARFAAPPLVCRGLIALGLAVGSLSLFACRGEITASDLEPPGPAVTGQPVDAEPALTPAQITVLTAGDPNAPPDLRREALLSITNSSAAGDPVYLDFYRAILAEVDTDPTVAAAAAAALANYGEPADTGYLTPLLGRPSPFLRWQTATALQRLHNTQAIAPLLEAAISDDDPDVRAAAAYALGQYARRDVFDGLITVLDDRDYGVSRAARETLTLITNHDAGDDPRQWLAYANQNPRTLFDEAQPYTYESYPRRNVFDLLQFWQKPTSEPTPPAGYQPPSADLPSDS